MEGVKTLHDLTNDFVTLQSMVEDETDMQVFQDTLDAINWQQEFMDKADSYVELFNNLKMTKGSLNGQLKAAKEVVESLSRSVKAIENKEDMVKQRLCDAMVLTDNRKFKTSKHSFWTQDSKSLKIDDIDAETIPLMYQKHTVEVDKDAVREALDNGKNVGFARYEEKTTLRFR